MRHGQMSKGIVLLDQFEPAPQTILSSPKTGSLLASSYAPYAAVGIGCIHAALGRHQRQDVSLVQADGGHAARHSARHVPLQRNGRGQGRMLRQGRAEAGAG